MPRLDTEPQILPPLMEDDWFDADDTELDDADAERDDTDPEHVLPLRAPAFTPRPQLIRRRRRRRLRHDTWGEITRDTVTDPFELRPVDWPWDDWTQ